MSVHHRSTYKQWTRYKHSFTDNKNYILKRNIMSKEGRETNPFIFCTKAQREYITINTKITKSVELSRKEAYR